MTHPLRILKRSKEMFVHEYTVNCISYSALMPDEIQKCFCGRVITKSFYVFTYFNKDTAIGMFNAGSGCGKTLLDIAGIQPPRLFDPFRIDNAHSSSSLPPENNISIEKNHTDFTPINKEIYNLLNLYRCMTHKALSGPLLTVFNFIKNNPTGDVYETYFKIIDDQVNNAVAALKFDTLQEYFERVAQQNNRRFKKFEFPLLKEKLDGSNENSR